jgi:hypothetical protein
VILFVYQQGSLCLGAGAVFGFAGAGLGKFVGPHIGLGEAGYVLGVPIGGLVIILTDIAIRARAYLNYECGLFGAFFWPSSGGMVNWFHASFDGLLVLALGVWLTSMAFTLQTRSVQDEARQAAAKKEAEHLAKITQRLPREGIEVRIVDDKQGTYSVSLINRTGKTFVKVRIVTRSTYFGGMRTQTLDWPQWKDGEAKTFLDPGRGVMTDFGFDMDGYPIDDAEPRYIIINFGQVKNGKWEQAKIGS